MELLSLLRLLMFKRLLESCNLGLGLVQLSLVLHERVTELSGCMVRVIWRQFNGSDWGW